MLILLSPNTYTAYAIQLIHSIFTRYIGSLWWNLKCNEMYRYVMVCKYDMNGLESNIAEYMQNVNEG